MTLLFFLITNKKKSLSINLLDYESAFLRKYNNISLFILYYIIYILLYNFKNDQLVNFGGSFKLKKVIYSLILYHEY